MLKRLVTIGIFLTAACPFFGQATTGYHRIGQVLQREPQGGVTAQVVPYATIYVTSTATGTAATIYSDPLLSAPISNSTVTSDENGNYGYYIALGQCDTENITYPGGGSITNTNVCTLISGTVSGQANGVIPLATGASLIGAQSHLSDNGSLVTSSLPLSVTGAVTASGGFNGVATGNLPLSGGTLTGPLTAQALSASSVNLVLNPAMCGTSDAPSWCAGSDLGAWINAANNSLAAGQGAIIDLGCSGDTTISTPIVIDRPVRLIGRDDACRLVPAAGLSGPMITFENDSNSAHNEFGQSIGQKIEHIWIEDTGWRTHSVDGINVLGQDQFFLTNVQVRSLDGYALMLNCNGCATANPVRESVFRDFRTWWTGDATNQLASIIINDDSSVGDRTNDIFFEGGQIIYQLYQAVHFDTQKTNGDPGPDSIFFHDFAIEGRELSSPLAGNFAAIAAPYDGVYLNHAGHIYWSGGYISVVGQGKSSFNAVGTSAVPVTFLNVENASLLGFQELSCTVNTSGTSVTITGGCTFPTDGSYVGLNVTIASVSYAVASVSTGTSFALTTSAGTQSGASMTIINGQTAFTTNYLTHGQQDKIAFDAVAGYATEAIGSNTGEWEDNFGFNNTGIQPNLSRLIAKIPLPSLCSIFKNTYSSAQGWQSCVNSDGSYSITPDTSTSAYFHVGSALSSSHNILDDGSGNLTATASISSPLVKSTAAGCSGTSPYLEYNGTCGTNGVLAGTSTSIGGSALTAGTCASTTVTITGATTGMVAAVDPVTFPGVGFYWDGYVSSANTVTVGICAAVAGTPTASTYNVRVIQ